MRLDRVRGDNDKTGVIIVSICSNVIGRSAMKRLVLVLITLFLFVNLGFTFHIVEAHDPSFWKWDHNNMNGWSMGGPWMGSPHWGTGFRNYGYNYVNPWQGPSLPYQGGGTRMYGSLSFYDFRQGPPCSYGSGWDGAAYGSFIPGDWYLNGGLYGLGRPSPFTN